MLPLSPAYLINQYWLPLLLPARAPRVLVCLLFSLPNQSRYQAIAPSDSSGRASGTRATTYEAWFGITLNNTRKNQFRVIYRNSLLLPG